MRIAVILGSTRPGRRSEAVGQWVLSVANTRSDASFELIDLAEVNLPLLDESVPAIFGVTEDPFIVYTSNIFAILGLRALYFVLASAMSKFHYLKIGLSMVLIFIGAKMLLSSYYHVPVGLSLGIVAGILAGSIVASLLRPPPPEPIGK